MLSTASVPRARRKELNTRASASDKRGSCTYDLAEELESSRGLGTVGRAEQARVMSRHGRTGHCCHHYHGRLTSSSARSVSGTRT